MSDETNIQKPGAEDVAVLKSKDDVQIHSAADGKQTPKRTPKRRSFIERAQQESEELVRTMGGTLELEGGRRTRSSTRGTPTTSVETGTPPPTKKAHTSPATTKSGGRGRGARKLDVGGDDEVEKEIVKETTVKQKDKTEKTPANKAAKPNVAAKKGKKDEKGQKPKDVEIKNKKDTKTTDEKNANDDGKKDMDIADVTESKVTESNDQPDSTAQEQEEKQNNISDKLSTKETEPKEKSPEPSEKPEEPAKVETPPKNDVTAPASDSAMEVDEDVEEKPSTEQTTKDTKSCEAAPTEVSEKVDEKKETEKSAESANSGETKVVANESAKQQTPEPMDVDSSSKASTETSRPISPVKDVASAETVTISDESDAAQTESSNNDVVEVETEVKKDAPVASETNAAEVENKPSENNTTKSDEAPASNDVSKPVTADVVAESAVIETPETPVKEPQVNSEKAEHKDNGEPKIVNNTTEDGENHVTPQACN